MFYHDKKLQFTVRVEKPNPLFARMLQQAIGGIEGEIRVCLQYLFQAWGARGPAKYRDMLLETGTEEISHIEMLCTAVAMNLDTASNELKDQIARDNPLVGAAMGGMDVRHILSSGMAAMATDANGVPFNGSWVVGSGNLAADMYANVMAESTGRLLATRLWELTDDPGMKDMLSFLIARDTMHQNQWLAVLEDLGGVQNVHPIPNSFRQTQEKQEFSYTFVSTNIADGASQQGQRWSSGTSIDGKGQFIFEKAQPYGEEPVLNPPKPEGHAQVEQMEGSTGIGGKISEFISEVGKKL
ncbi:manganese catalase family protein [Cytophagaceae bacterium DM2B3-1]|uniref:Manganese catalase family protein n=1 Tax=Xanthocytophaga flava TaxID=3048013 RepID=A0ABT7CIJ2_9BACT|nr:manganese catalase family protein [Xanthocytophaga flavus]MDJ1469566.1 manganese catalase family protein [Xanthocytophaga flavus]MDJ1493512.1 manganese catalase family protein [Xanthocytophaga flavus]